MLNDSGPFEELRFSLQRNDNGQPINNRRIFWSESMENQLKYNGKLQTNGDVILIKTKSSNHVIIIYYISSIYIINTYIVSTPAIVSRLF